MTDADDDVLIERLRLLADTVDAPPAHVDAAAEQALLTRRLDAELAELITDSAYDAGELVRSDSEMRLLSLASAQVAVELQVTPLDEATVTVRGFVDGATGTVRIDWADGSLEVPLDDAGWFSIATLPQVTARLHLTGDDGSPVVTAWITL